MYIPLGILSSSASIPSVMAHIFCCTNGCTDRVCCSPCRKICACESSRPLTLITLGID